MFSSTLTFFTGRTVKNCSISNATSIESTRGEHCSLPRNEISRIIFKPENFPREFEIVTFWPGFMAISWTQVVLMTKTDENLPKNANFAAQSCDLPQIWRLHDKVCAIWQLTKDVIRIIMIGWSKGNLQDKYVNTAIDSLLDGNWAAGARHHNCVRHWDANWCTYLKGKIWIKSLLVASQVLADCLFVFVLNWNL